MYGNDIPHTAVHGNTKFSVNSLVRLVLLAYLQCKCALTGNDIQMFKASEYGYANAIGQLWYRNAHMAEMHIWQKCTYGRNAHMEIWLRIGRVGIATRSKDSTYT